MPLELTSARPSLGCATIGARPARASASPPVQELAVQLGLAEPDHHDADRRHVHEIAGAHRPGARHDGVHARR